MQNKAIIALLLICFTSIVVANTNPKAEYHDKSLTESFTQQWGLAAIKIPSQSSTPSIQEWSGSISNQTLTSPHVDYFPTDQLIYSKQLTSGINAAYHYGRFHAETGLLSQTSDVLDSDKFYLQGSFSVFIKDKFDLALTAKFEALDMPYINSNITELRPTFKSQGGFNYQAKQASIGLISTYSINKKWILSGSFTTTSYQESALKSPFTAINNTHMALIGTTYSF